MWYCKWSLLYLYNVVIEFKIYNMIFWYLLLFGVFKIYYVIFLVMFLFKFWNLVFILFIYIYYLDDNVGELCKMLYGLLNR